MADARDCPHIPLLSVRGTNYQVGRQIGSTFKDQFRHFLSVNVGMRDRYMPYFATARGRQAYESYLAESTRAFPHLVDEIRGISDGANIEFEKIFLLHIQDEFEVLVRQDATVSGQHRLNEGCTAILINSKQGMLLGHTEDMTPELVGGGYMLVAHVLPSKTNGHVHERFTAFAYPGNLVGATFGFNQHGLAHCGNNISVQQVDTHNRIPRRLLLRALVSAKSIDGAIDIIARHRGIASGFTLNLCERRSVPGRMVSVEMYGTPTGTKLNVKEIAPEEAYFHANMFLEVDTAQYTDQSSIERLSRFRELTAETNLSNIGGLKTLLSDTGDNAMYPLYRKGISPDSLSTGATCLIQGANGLMHVYSGKASQSWPAFTLDMDGHGSFFTYPNDI